MILLSQHYLLMTRPQSCPVPTISVECSIVVGDVWSWPISPCITVIGEREKSDDKLNKDSREANRYPNRVFSGEIKYYFASCFLSINFNIILPPTSRSPK
jgi:hypothetical protein